MAKAVTTRYVCTQCATAHTKWQGRCTGCGNWNTLVEELGSRSGGALPKALAGSAAAPRTLAEIPLDAYPRLELPDAELNRVLDGGLVPGSLVLLGGEPGIGKSTLLLQLAQRLAGCPILYVTGEESPEQVKRRAERIEGHNPALYLLPETRLEALLAQAEALRPLLLIVDSIQTLTLEGLESAAGSVAQVRECTARLLRYAKDTHTSVLLVGHITKDGLLAGPKVLEHMVDVVLTFEGERTSGYRVLRSSKNRFGATPELGVYAMYAEGLREVPNPSELFLSHRAEPVSGTATAATLEANRVLLIETQALVADASYGTAQRVTAGVDPRRMHLLLAVLEKRGGFKLSSKDVFVNLAGGVRLDDPALDLPLALAIVSSAYDLALPPGLVLAAEVSLTGELRPISRLEARATEAAKLGYTTFIACATGQQYRTPRGIEVLGFGHLTDVCRHVFG